MWDSWHDKGNFQHDWRDWFPPFTGNDGLSISTEYGYPAIVTKVAPSGRFDIAVEAVNHSDAVYAYDNASAPD